MQIVAYQEVINRESIKVKTPMEVVIIPIFFDLTHPAREIIEIKHIMPK